MKRYLSMLVLLVAVSLAGLSPVSSLAADPPAANTQMDMIHLNQATVEDLQDLPGVGPALSERIVQYRTEHGPFSSVDQLADVKGVGQAKLAKFRNRLTID